MLVHAENFRPAVEHPAVGRLRSRAEFVVMRGAARDDRPTFILRARRRARGTDAQAIRFGFTVTLKTGNAVERNRIRRRLREAVRRNSGGGMLPGHDYELIGKRAALTAGFGTICRQLDKALANVAQRLKSKGNGAEPVF